MTEQLPSIVKELEEWLKKQIEEEIDVGTYDDALRDTEYEMERLKTIHGYG